MHKIDKAKEAIKQMCDENEIPAHERKTADHKVILEPFPQQFERSRRNLLAFSAILFCFFCSGLYEEVNQQHLSTPPSGLWDVFIWLQQTLPWVWPVLSTYFFLSFFLQALSYWQENRLRLSGGKLSELTSGNAFNGDGKPRNNYHNTAAITLVRYIASVPPDPNDPTELDAGFNRFAKGLKLYGYTQLADKLMIGTGLPLLFGLFTLIISSCKLLTL